MNKSKVQRQTGCLAVNWPKNKQTKKSLCKKNVIQNAVSISLSPLAPSPEDCWRQAGLLVHCSRSYSKNQIILNFPAIQFSNYFIIIGIKANVDAINIYICLWMFNWYK